MPMWKDVWDGADLKVIDVDEVPSDKRMGVFIPGKDLEGNKDILELLGFQNPRLDLSSWSIIKRVNVAGGTNKVTKKRAASGIFLVIRMNDATVESLKAEKNGGMK